MSLPSGLGWRLPAVFGAAILIAGGVLQAAGSGEVRAALAEAAVPESLERTLAAIWIFAGWHTFLLGGIGLVAVVWPGGWTRWALAVLGIVALADAFLMYKCACFQTSALFFLIVPGLLFVWSSAVLGSRDSPEPT